MSPRGTVEVGAQRSNKEKAFSCFLWARGFIAIAFPKTL
jgi:hypothetical protein